ncbi:MAG: VOC family protein [Rhizobacter sp.]|nr:VOC family protein [Rhizobacter sp.]
MSSNPFVWYELMTSDPPAATKFYEKVLGMSGADSGMPGMNYTIVSAGGAPVGGVMEIPAEAKQMGARPAWVGYIGVPDVDAFAAKLKAAGGTVHRPAQDIPGVGRFAVVADPQGAAFMLFKGSIDEAPPAAADGTPGHVGWHELHAGDGPAAFAFYSGLFGWTKGEAMDMGPMGVYQLFAAGGQAIGGMMTKTPETPAPNWLYYFNVDALDAAIERVKAGGGKVPDGPMEVPGPMWVARCSDPQGAMFAMVAPKR